MDMNMLVQMLNEMPPEEIGKLISQIQNPQGYLDNKMFDQRGEGYRGNLPLSMRPMSPRLGGNPVSPIQNSRNLPTVR